VNRTITQRGSDDGGISRTVTGAKEFVRAAVLWLTVWHVAFCPGPASTAFGQILHFDPTALDPAMRARVQAALVKLKESPSDISAVETLLAIEPRVVEAVGSSKLFSGSDPVRNQALKWGQGLQPTEVLVTSLEKGSDAAVHWALRQIVWRRHNDWFDKESLARLMPGIEMALVKPPPATRAQAVRTMMVCLPLEHRTGFLRGLLKGQPDEVRAAAVELFANDLRQTDPDVEVIVAKWLNESDAPLLLRACCTHWWLVKSQSTSDVKESEIAAFERLAGHQDATVRSSVTLAVQAAATPSRPRIVGILLRLTHDKDSSVNWNAVRALRNANTLEANARLRELFATDQPQNLRAAAIEVLGIFGKDNLPLILSAAKTDKDPSVRQNAVYALRQIGTPEAGQGLDAARRDPDDGVRREAQTQFEWFRKEHPTRQ
jgi:HEAT repeats